MTEFDTTSAQSILESEWRWQLADNPEYASQAGQNHFDNSLQDLSPEAFEKRITHNRLVLSSIQQLLTASIQCSEEEKLHLEFLSKSVQDELRAFELGCHLYPVNSIGYGGVHNNFIEALEWLGENNKSQNFLRRLQLFPEQCEQYKALLRKGIEHGHVASVAMVRKVPEQLENIIKALQENRGPICSMLSSLGLDRNEVAIRDKSAFGAAIADLKAFFINDYIPHARTICGASGLPKGDEVYAHCLKYHTTTNMSPDEVHNLGLQEVARIESRYQHDVLDKLSFEGTFSDFVESVKSPQSGQFYRSEADILDGYRILCSFINSKLHQYFEKLPSTEVEIVSLNSTSAPAAYYMQGTADGARPGRFYVNVSNLHQRPIYEMVALALHEAVPGHHLQMALAIENESIPSFLRFMEDRRYEYCPARRNMYTAYAEGWALYCEALGEEMGMYASPMSVFGRLSMEMMRAVRLVVDSGIHHKGWSVEQAIEYMMEKTGMHRHEVEAECYRYEAWPGQACAYKVGEVAIWRMRKFAEQELGPKFDLKKFHSCLLDSGPMPLDTLENQVKAWVASAK